MLDRYTISLNADELALVLGVEVPEEYVPEFNAAPTKLLPVITSKAPDKIQVYGWGLMSAWSNNKTMSPKFFNLQLDSVLNKSSYRKKLLSNRCIIPMDGFYFWKRVTKKRLIPHYISYSDKRVFSVAGLWEENEGRSSFTIILKNANGQLRELQEDMPLIMDPMTSKSWLGASNIDQIEDVLKQDHKKEQFVTNTVSPRINDLSVNDASLIKSTPPADQLGNYTLFS